MSKSGKIISWIGTILLVTIGLFEIVFWFGTPPNTIDSNTSYSTVDEVKIAYTMFGNGPPLMMLHSSGWSSIEYDMLAEPLSKHYTIYLVDMPGFGMSDKPQTSYTLEYLSDNMKGFVEQFPEEHFSIIGSSIGGSVATQLAAEFPDRIDNVILIDPFGFGKDINQTAIIAQVPVLAEAVFFPNKLTFNYVLDHGLLSSESLTPEYREELYIASQSPKAQRAKLSVLRTTITMRGVHPDVIDMMRNAGMGVQQPTLLLWGENDTYAPTEQHYEAMRYIPQAQYQSLEKAGHFAHMESPYIIAQLILDFLKDQKSDS